MKPFHCISLFLFAIFCTCGAFAQKIPRTSRSAYTQIPYVPHEISVYGGGGLSTLSYQLAEGERSAGLGGLFGLGYTYSFDYQWALATGLEISLYNAKTKFFDFFDRYGTQDDEGDFFDFQYTIRGYSEQQRAVLLNIPVMAQYNYGLFYAALGFKLGIPMQTTYKVSATEVVALGLYENYVPLTDPTFSGFGKFGTDRRNDLNFKPVAFMLAAEAGMRRGLFPDWTIYTCVYFDYGLHNVINQSQQVVHIVQYDNVHPDDFAYNSSVISRHSIGNGAETEGFTNKLAPLAVGVKIKLAFNPSKKRVIRYYDKIML